MAELLDFPCAYTVKVIGEAGEDFTAEVHAIVVRHAGESAGEPDVRPSSKGRFAAINITFVATGMGQLHALHTELRAHHKVRTIL